MAKEKIKIIYKKKAADSIGIIREFIAIKGILSLPAGL